MKQIEIDLPKARWILVDIVRDNFPEVLFVNEALVRFQHIEIFPWHLSISLSYSDFIEQKMPTPDEYESLNRVCSRIEDIVLASQTNLGYPNALEVARSTWNGVRELTFVVHDPEILNGVLQAATADDTWGRQWSYRMDHDPEWHRTAVFLGSITPKKQGLC